MLVEGTCEVTFQQLIIIDGLSYDTTNKLEVAQMVGVAVRRGVDCVCDAVTRGSFKQGIHWVEDLPGNDNVPFSQQTSSILALFTCK
jgi:hypothetical protein